MDISFKDPWILYLIPFVMAIIYILSRRGESARLRFSSLNILSGIKASWKVRAAAGIIYLRLFIIILFLVALAGPRQVLQQTEIETEGIDIILTLDASGSMAAEDFIIQGKRMNRLEIVKEVVKDFIPERKGDRIGIVVFAAQAYTACPLTTDHDWLLSHLARVELGIIQDDGTAIGSALGTSLARLKESEAKSKIVILLTDGKNNAGELDPLETSEAAEALGIKIYTIGAGSKGLVPFPTKDIFGRTVYRKVKIDMDEDLLRQIARNTDGKYFRATNTEALRDIYKEIDRLEKTERKEKGYKEYKQLFPFVLLPALVLLSLELVFKNTVLLKIP